MASVSDIRNRLALAHLARDLSVSDDEYFLGSDSTGENEGLIAAADEEKALAPRARVVRADSDEEFADLYAAPIPDFAAVGSNAVSRQSPAPLDISANPDVSNSFEALRRT